MSTDNAEQRREQHFRRLEQMYRTSPINAFYGAGMDISSGKAEVKLKVRKELHHSAGAVHGSVSFKLLDDACFFAASSVEEEFFVLTSAFTTYLLRPCAEGSLHCVGTVMNAGRRQILCEGTVLNDEGKVVARGSGTFMRSDGRLLDLPGYARSLDEAK